MILGRVNDALEATLEIEVRGPHTDIQIVTAVIDTGFSGFLTLPRKVANDLALPALAPRLVRLADGTERFVKSSEATLNWHGIDRTVRALTVEGDALVGTALLRDSDLFARFVEGGLVRVEPINRIDQVQSKD